MEMDDLDDFADFLSRRGPLGNRPMAPTAALAPVSQGLAAAAKNLLRKARAALEKGDDPRADRFIERAMDLAFDEHEEVHPALVEAHMDLYLVLDKRALLGDGDQWLAPALTVYADATGRRRELMGSMLSTIARDIVLSHAERKKLRRALDSEHEPYEPWDDPPAERADRAEYVRTMLSLHNAYERECRAAGLPDLSWLRDEPGR